MTRVQHITNDTLSCRLYFLRTNRHALIKLSTQQKLMTPTKYRAYQPKAGKTNAAIRPTRPANIDRQAGTKAKAPIKSP